MSEATLLPVRSLVEARRDEIKAIVGRHRGVAVALFGSVARGEEGPRSDVDLLVEFAPGSSLFDLVRLQDELSVRLGRAVDVVSVGGLHPDDEDIRQDAVWL